MTVNNISDLCVIISSPNNYFLFNNNGNRSETSEEIPLLEKRVQVLQEAGGVLLQNFNGSFINLLIQSNHKVKNLLPLIVSSFSSYKDEAIYEEKVVKLYKRAQILIADIWACCEGKGLGYFEDIEDVTMFADYRVPQVSIPCPLFTYVWLSRGF